MQNGPKAVWSIPYISVAFFPSLKQNFITYRTSKVSSRPDCIFEIHQLRQALVECIPIAAVAVHLNLKSSKLVRHLIRCIAITNWIFKSLQQFEMPAQKSLETYWMHYVSLLIP